MRPAYVLGCRRQAGSRPETTRTPVAGVEALSPPPRRQKNPCLRGHEGDRAISGPGDGDGPRPSGKCRSRSTKMEGSMKSWIPDSPSRRERDRRTLTRASDSTRSPHGRDPRRASRASLVSSCTLALVIAVYTVAMAQGVVFDQANFPHVRFPAPAATDLGSL